MKCVTTIVASLLWLSTYGHPHPPEPDPIKIGVLYLSTHENNKQIGDKIREFQKSWNSDTSHSYHLEDENLLIRPYSDNNNTQVKNAFEEMLDEGVDILIGPSTSRDLRIIEEYIDSEKGRGKALPYFICPTVSTKADTYDRKVAFINTISTNRNRVNLLREKLLGPYGIHNIGLLYENNAWGLDILEEFDENEDFHVIGKPFPNTDDDDVIRSTIRKFISDVAEKDTRLLVLALWEDETAGYFLDLLKEYNAGKLVRYHPMIVFFRNHKLTSINDAQWVKGLDIFGVTEFSDVTSEDMSEELALTTDAFNLTISILEDTINLALFKERYEQHIGGKPATGTNAGTTFNSQVFTLPTKNLKWDMDNLNLFKVQLDEESKVKKAETKDLPDGPIGRFWRAQFLPLWRYHNFPNNSLLFLTFLLLTLLAFAVFLNIEYYAPYGTLIKSKLFWIWFAVYFFITLVAVTTVLFLGYIPSDRIEVILLAGLTCPVIINVLIKQAPSVEIPGVSKYLAQFLDNLKSSVEKEFSHIVPKQDSDKLVQYIAQSADFSKVRIAVYGLIMDMPSNGLTKKFSADLKKLSSSLDEWFADQNIKQTPDIQKTRQERFIRFYLRALFFVSRNEKTFKERLIHSGLGDEGKLLKLLSHDEESSTDKEPQTEPAAM